MRKINRDEEPAEWQEYKKRHPKSHYRDLDLNDAGKDMRRRMRKHLAASQYFLCAYCCRQIDAESSLNEHIKPQGVSEYEKYSMDYDNLVASCNVREEFLTCSARKGNKYDDKLFVSPLQEGCESNFVFSPNGEILGITEGGKYTCELLGLNSYILQRARKAQYKVCRAYPNQEYIKDFIITPQEGKLEPFVDMITYFYNLGDFAEDMGGEM